MPFLSEKDTANLLAVLDAIGKIQKFTEDFDNADELYADDLVFDAVLMNFVVIGETVVKLSSELISETNRIPWLKIKSFRNLIAHNYFGIDAEEVWQIAKNNLPDLKIELNKLINSV
jgi:uncharacterized protein with HEPN domain